MDRSIRARVHQAVEVECRENGFPAVVLHLAAPSAGLDETVATGYRDLRSSTPITGDEVFRIASNTKTFTSASILRLMESGQLDLDASIASLLPEEYTGLLRDAGYDPERITVRHLLQHTSGMHDNPALDELVLVEPSRHWTPLELVRITMEGSSPLADPGQIFDYFDHGYTLLGRIVERATGLPQAKAYRALIPFDAIPLRHTWFESLEPPPPDAPPRAHQYWHGQDAETFDPSIDLYGGGGLLSTVADLATFYRALLTGHVFENSATLDLMLEIPEVESPVDYAMGIERVVVNDVALWGHRGYWGSACFHAPDRDVTVALTRNAHDAPEGYTDTNLIGRILEILASPE